MAKEMMTQRADMLLSKAVVYLASPGSEAVPALHFSQPPSVSWPNMDPPPHPNGGSMNSDATKVINILMSCSSTLARSWKTPRVYSSGIISLRERATFGLPTEWSIDYIGCSAAIVKLFSRLVAEVSSGHAAARFYGCLSQFNDRLRWLKGTRSFSVLRAAAVRNLSSSRRCYLRRISMIRFAFDSDAAFQMPALFTSLP